MLSSKQSMGLTRVHPVVIQTFHSANHITMSTRHGRFITPLVEAIYAQFPKTVIRYETTAIRSSRRRRSTCEASADGAYSITVFSHTDGHAQKVFLLGSVMAPDSTCFSFDRVNFLGELFPQNTDLFFSVGFLSVGGVGPVWLKCRSGADSAELSSFRYSR